MKVIANKGTEAEIRAGKKKLNDLHFACAGAASVSSQGCELLDSRGLGHRSWPGADPGDYAERSCVSTAVFGQSLPDHCTHRSNTHMYADNM